MTVTKSGRPIRTLKEWGDLAGPKSEYQWSEDRSAMECARSWLAVTAPSLPREIDEALSSHSDFGVLASWEAEPEVRLPFDDLRGEPRNTDMLVRARDNLGELLLAVEAKADEPFGELVPEALATALERKLKNTNSRGLERIESLAASLFRVRAESEAPLAAIRYQLLTATAGAIAAGIRSEVPRVVLMIHEFQTKKTTDVRHAENARDLDAFVHRLSHGRFPCLRAGSTVGPFIDMPGKPLFDVVPRFYVAKASCDIRNRQPNEEL
jgi:hypothetical protein